MNFLKVKFLYVFFIHGNSKKIMKISQSFCYPIEYDFTVVDLLHADTDCMVNKPIDPKTARFSHTILRVES